MKHTKKVISVVVILTLLLGIFSPLAVSANCDFLEGGIRYKYNSTTCVLDVYSEGSYNANGVPSTSQYYPLWQNIRNDANKIIFHNGIKTTGADSFSYFTSVVTISFCNTINRINLCSFMYCTSLQTLVTPVPVRSLYIGIQAFYGLNHLDRL